LRHPSSACWDALPSQINANWDVRNRVKSGTLTARRPLSVFANEQTSSEPVSMNVLEAEVISLQRARYRPRWLAGHTRAVSDDQGFVLPDEAKAFFTAVENFAQLQDSSESSPQRVAFDLSTRRFAAGGGKVVGDNTIGGPTA
jgi:hypothetical protein